MTFLFDGRGINSFGANCRGIILTSNFGVEYLACKTEHKPVKKWLDLPVMEFWTTPYYGEEFLYNLHQYKSELDILLRLYSYVNNGAYPPENFGEKQLVEFISNKLFTKELLIFSGEQKKQLFIDNLTISKSNESLLFNIGNKQIFKLCTRDTFTISCGHSDRNYTLDLLTANSSRFENRLSVVGKDKINILQSGSCVHGKLNCPSIFSSGPDLHQTDTESSFSINVNSPGSTGNIATIKDFIDSFMNGYESYQTYNISAQGCNSNQAKGIVWAYDPYEFSGSFSLGYNGDAKKWETESSLKGLMGASKWDLVHTSAENSFVNFLNKLNNIIDQVEDLVSEADGGDGPEIWSMGFVPPKIGIGGGLKLAEIDASPDVGLQGNLSLSFTPLIGFSIKVDVITALVKAIFPKPIADPLLSARASAEEGLTSGNGKVKFSAEVKIDLELSNRIDSTSGWDFKPDGSCLPGEGSDAGKTEITIDVTLKASTNAKGEVLWLKVQIGSEMAMKSADGTKGVGLTLTLSPTVINNKPAMAGKAEFTGAKIIYSAHVSVMIKSSESHENVNRGGRMQKDTKPATSVMKKVEGEYTVFEAVTIFDTGKSTQGENLSNVQV